MPRRPGGKLGPGLAADIAQGRFRRMLEWRTESGRLRFGIPQRLDGLVRMELRHGADLSTGERWGLDELR